MAARGILQDNITTYLVNLLNSIKGEIEVVWREYQRDAEGDNLGSEYTVFRAQQEQLVDLPSIEVILKGKTNEIKMIGTQQDTFNYDLIVSIDSNHPEWGDTYCRVVVDAIEQYLNDYKRRKFEIPETNFCAFYSEAKNTDYSFRRGQGLRSAKISWSCIIFKPDKYY
jgi:hypothetical protein